MLKSCYVNLERKIPALIADFRTNYALHDKHTVIFFYDATTLGSNYAVNNQDLILSKSCCASAKHSKVFYALHSACADFPLGVIHEFERHGWQVQDVYLSEPMRYDEKYFLINQGIAGM